MINLNKLPSNVAGFMPRHQQKIVLHPDSYEEFQDVIDRLEQEISAIPENPQEPLHDKGSIHDRYKVFAHFFYGGCDWFILDWDRERNVVYCYAILNEDTQMSEFGYTYLPEITEDGRVELDFYWTPCTLAEALYHKYPDEFAKPFIEATKPTGILLDDEQVKILTAIIDYDYASEEKDYSICLFENEGEKAAISFEERGEYNPESVPGHIYHSLRYFKEILQQYEESLK